MQSDSFRANESAPGQYLTFSVGEHEYAFDILRVQEIRAFAPITPIPNAPSFVKGVMNLRGIVVPIIALRDAFGLSPGSYGKFSVIVVINVGAKVIGMLVDAVSDVVELAVAAVDLPSELGVRVDTSFVAGIGSVVEKLIVVLDIEQLVARAGIATEVALEPAANLTPP
jgi:purine-binding chemotaxis protein CheW